MKKISRRKFLEMTSIFGLSAMTHSVLWPSLVAANESSRRARVVIIGGGFGGATCAKYLKRLDHSVQVTLIEKSKQFVTCPFSNTVIGGMNGMDYISHDYDRLKDKYGVQVVVDTVVSMDARTKQLVLSKGGKLSYDRLVVSPGIDFIWNEVEGYSQAVSERLPHAWQGGPQTILLRKQLEAMKDGGVVIIAPPNNPFRCPPGPYERASLIAYYLKQYKPKSKIIILDAKEKFSKQALFMQGWSALYPGMIEWVKASAGGHLQSMDANKHTLINELGDRFKADVINFIPSQKAARIAHTAGLVDDKGWCPIHQRTFESSKQKDVYVLGDASIAGKMPKSGFAANSQAKVCAAAITASLHGFEMPEPSYVNTCYSLLSPDYGISVAAVYKVTEAGIVPIEGSGGVSPDNADRHFRQQEANYAVGWYQSITSDIFA